MMTQTISEDRRAIDNASKLLYSDEWSVREEGFMALKSIHSLRQTCPYHKVLICTVLIDLGGDVVKDLKPWATECIDTCQSIINQERMAPDSCARQPYDDMIHKAQDTLTDIRRNEAVDAPLYRRIIFAEMGEEEFEKYQDGELARENFFIDEEDGDMEIDDEDRDAGEEEHGVDDEPETEAAYDERFEQALQEGYDQEIGTHNSTPNPLESRITRNPDFVEQDHSETIAAFEFEDQNQVNLIGQFVELVKEDRQLMEEVLHGITGQVGHQRGSQHQLPRYEGGFSIRVRPQNESEDAGAN